VTVTAYKFEIEYQVKNSVFLSKKGKNTNPERLGVLYLQVAIFCKINIGKL